MAKRLTLDTTGISGPLDIQTTRPAKPAATTTVAPAPVERGGEMPIAKPASRARKPAKPTATAPTSTTMLYGAGRPIQTALRLDLDLIEQFAQLAHDTGISFNTLLVATLHQALPATLEEAARLMILERANHPQPARAERNLRLPEQLRERLDQLAAAVRKRSPRATRADLINAALRQRTPPSQAQAAETVAAYRRELELSALSAA
jgi:predicted DNA-binding protein